ncbi:MAG: hypothetical protein ACPGVO_20560 [Spirulinaceae cyanobacterium]
MDDSKLDVLKEKCPTFLKMVIDFEGRLKVVNLIAITLCLTIGIASLVFGILQKDIVTSGIGIALLIIVPLVVIDIKMKNADRKNYLARIQRSPGSVADYRYFRYDARIDGKTMKRSHAVVVTFNDRKKAEFGAKDEAQAKQAVQDLAVYLASFK